MKFPKPNEDSIIYEDDKLYACLASDAVATGHVIVAWKKDVPDLHFLSGKDYVYLMEKVDEVRDAIMKVLGVEKVYLVYMDEAKHVHWHLIPRYNKKGYNVFLHNPVKIKDFSLAEKIKDALGTKITLYIVRHGETAADKKGILKGHGDSDLTVKGIGSAASLAKKLKDKEIDVIYTSDLGRCLTTANVINKLLDVDVIKTEKLRERDFGNLNSRPIKLASQVLNFSNPDEIAPSGESFNQMKVRILKFLDTLCDCDYKNILIVTHEGPLRAILSDYYSVPFGNKKCDTETSEVYKLDLHK